MKTKRIAVVCSGWHYPRSFYENMAKQKMPKGWSMDLFCIAHRNPEDKLSDVFPRLDTDLRGNLDKKLYGFRDGEEVKYAIPTVEEIKQYGWQYDLMPNTIGDWGNTNQWFDLMGDKAKEYDLYLFTHDDNLLIHDRIIADTIEDSNYKKWGICANSAGMPYGWIRGSFEFFKPKVLEKMGWKFDLSRVTLTREGQTTAGTDRGELDDWNNTVHPLMEFIKENKIKLAFLSPAYRVSAYVIEGERGFISCTHGINTQYEDAGLEYLKQNGII